MKKLVNGLVIGLVLTIPVTASQAAEGPNVLNQLPGIDESQTEKSKNAKRIDPGTAQRVANLYLEKVVFTHMYPGWKGAKAQAPELFYTVDGAPAVYSVKVVRNNDTVGYMVIGATKDMSPIITVGTGQPPVDKIEIVKEKAKEKLKNGQQFGSYRLVYGGPMFLGIQFDILDGKKAVGRVTYHLQGEFSMETFPSPISTPEYQQQARGQWERQLSLTEGIISPQSFVQSKDLNVASYDQAKSNSEYNGCGPAAGAMILDYWDINGYTNLQDDADRATGVNLMNHLFGDMGTGPTGTSTTGWISGIKTHANSHSGYNFNSWTRYWDSTIRGTFWSELKNEINAGRPFGMWFPLNYQPYSAHIVPCRGFFEDEYSQKYHVNTWGYDAWHDYSSTTGFHMMYVWPGTK